MDSLRRYEPDQVLRDSLSLRATVRQAPRSYVCKVIHVVGARATFSVMFDGLFNLCGWLIAHGSSCAELFGFITGVLNVWLVTRENIWSWPLGVLNAGFYIVVFARTGLYSDTGLQVVYFTLSFYGWWHWARRDASRAPLVVTRASLRLLWFLTALCLGIWFVLYTITSRIPGVAMPRLDAALVAVSLIAQWMMTRKLLENWLLWIAVDVVYVPLFLVRGLRLTAALYTAFLILAIIGLVQWHRSANRTNRLPLRASS